ncbi:hypothetical protein [Sulfodiicoccus acidiphilus]|nr:hypothetical protein [Sulfodiicoccus acidiphilus]
MSKEGELCAPWMADSLDGEEWRFRRMDRLSRLSPHLLLVRRCAAGELLALNKVSHVVDVEPSPPPDFPPHGLRGRVIQVGWPAPGGGVVLWSEPPVEGLGDQVRSFLPLPVREGWADGAVLGEVAEHEVVSEVHRALKRGGEVVAMTRQPSEGGLDPVVLTSALAWRFQVRKVEVVRRTWIVRGVKP